MRDMLDIIKNIDSIYNSNSSLSVLKDFERVLDELNVYVFENWLNGELVEGPIVNRHWVIASFMWPTKEMPNPEGAKLLQDYGCKVKYTKTHYLVPRQVEDPDDFIPGTKRGKLDRIPVWEVIIKMPKKLLSDIYNGYMSRMKDEAGIGKQRDENTISPIQSAEQTAMNTGMVPGAMPGAAPGAMPGAAPGAMPGAAPGAMPGGQM